MADQEGPSIHSNPLSMMAWMNSFIMLILTIPALSVVVFLRYKFGCRFLKLWMAVAVFLALWIAYSGFISPFSLDIAPARIFGVAMLGLAIYHSKTAWKLFWSAAGRPELLWHSMNDGIPRLRALFPTVSDSAA